MSFNQHNLPSTFVRGAGPNMYGIKNASVVKLIIQTAGTYNEQYRRPLTSSADGRIVNMVEDALDRSRNLDALALAVPAFEMLKPAAMPESAAQIPNGWATERYRFLLHITIEDHMGVIINHYYTGFTEYTDPSFSGQLDPNMVFTINANSSTRTVSTRSPTGMTVYQAPISDNQVVASSAEYKPDLGVMSPSKTYSLRPESVIHDIMSEDLRSQTDTFLDTVTMISAPQLSERSNNSAANYMSKMIGGFRNTILGNSNEEARDTQLDHLKNLVTSSPFNTDQFLAWLLTRRVNQPTMNLGQHQFTLSELEVFDPTMRSRIVPADTLGAARNFHQVGQSSDWGQSTATVQFATLLAQALPTYMSSMRINVLKLTAHNLNMTGEIQTLIENCLGYNNAMDMSPYLPALVQRLNTELFSAISFGNTMPFSVQVMCDLLGETWITLSLAQMPEETFVTPTFCDSLITPMASNQLQNLQNLSHDFGKLFDLVENKSLPSSLSGEQYTVMGDSISGSNLVTPTLNTPSAPASSSIFPQSNITPFGKKDPGF